MGLFDSFKSKTPEPENGSAANDEPQVSLQLLFAAPFELTPTAFARDLVAYDTSLANVRISLTHANEGSALGQISWGKHTVQAVVIGAPMPSPAVEKCVQPAAYSPALKTEARAHQAHAILFYRGANADISEQYTALALVAGALCGQGAIVVMNEAAQTSLPARFFTDPELEYRQALFDSMPVLLLFAGFVKYQLEGQPGVWMRTHGLSLWGLPDLATLVESHARGREIFEIFSDVANYMIAKGPILCAGHTMQLGDDVFMKLSDPTPAQRAMGQPEEVLIAEFIRSDQSNPFVMKT